MKTNRPGEIQKDPTALSLVFAVVPTELSISTFPVQLEAQKWQTVREPCDKPAFWNQNHLIHQVNSEGMCLVDTGAGKQ